MYTTLKRHEGGSEERGDADNFTRKTRVVSHYASCPTLRLPDLFTLSTPRTLRVSSESKTSEKNFLQNKRLMF